MGRGAENQPNRLNKVNLLDETMRHRASRKVVVGRISASNGIDEPESGASLLYIQTAGGFENTVTSMIHAMMVAETINLMVTARSSRKLSALWYFEARSTIWKCGKAQKKEFGKKIVIPTVWTKVTRNSLGTIARSPALHVSIS